MYRYEMDPYGPPLFMEFRVLRETPCGFWIALDTWGDQEKWVSKTGRKRYAYPTEELAKESFIARQMAAHAHFTRKAGVALEYLNSIGYSLKKFNDEEWWVLTPKT